MKVYFIGLQLLYTTVIHYQHYTPARSYGCFTGESVFGAVCLVIVLSVAEVVVLYHFKKDDV